MPKLNLLGHVYGRLTVIELAPSRGTHTYWKCQCECGNGREVEVANLRSGRAKSCGCLRDEIAKTTASSKFTKHGDHKTRLYSTFKNMHQRCYLPSHTAFPNYGAKGVTVSPEWSTYEKFKEWALNSGYTDVLTLDRVQSELGYSPDNCRWATYETQTQNRRKTTSATSSQYLGVSWCTSRKAWRAAIQVSKKTIDLGAFPNELDAAKARDFYITTNQLHHFKKNF